ncbi:MULTISPECIES: type B 50S ribosomal protein L31 [unclassified Pseudomonas]|uniref:type B 50S ribosomal protein L31 n=1 Tax=unclassified Pseudomonas TaxID=196821 RepID=UPI00384D2068
MKTNTHQDYRNVLFHDTAADAFFLIPSTVESHSVRVHSDGHSYPYVALDISSASHPLYTHQQRKAGSEGRIAGFNKRFAGFGSVAA